MRLIIILLFCLSTAVKAQPNPDTLWTHTCGGSNEDWAYSVQQTADGGYVVAGSTISFGAGESDAYLVKTNEQGDTLWTRTYGGIYEDFAYSVQQTVDGGFVIAGSTNSFGAGHDDIFVVRTDGQGDTLWTRTYGGSGSDDANSIRQTTDGGYVIAGFTNDLAGNTDFLVVKTDGQGDTLWTRTYGASHVVEVASSIQQTADGGYVIAGSDFWLVRTNSQGDTLWTRTYGGSGSALSLQRTMDGGYVLAGYSSFSGESTDFYVVKTNGQGDTLWTRTYGGFSIDRAMSVQQTSDSGFVVTGQTVSFGAGGFDFYVVKTDAHGDTLWSRTYGGSDYDHATSIQQTTDGGYVIAGATESFGAGDYDLYLVKTGPDVLGTGPDKFGTLPVGFTLFPNHPNPFNSSTTISFELPRASRVLLNVFDITGRAVVTLSDELLEAGAHHVNFDAATLPSGIYVYRLTSGNISQARKFVLLR